MIVENIRRFHDLLAQDPAPAQRELLEGLLREEEQKLKSLDTGATLERSRLKK